MCQKTLHRSCATSISIRRRMSWWGFVCLLFSTCFFICGSPRIICGFGRSSNLHKVVARVVANHPVSSSENHNLLQALVFSRDNEPPFLGIEPDSVSFARHPILIVKHTVPSNSELDREREQDFSLENPPRARNNAEVHGCVLHLAARRGRDPCHRETFVLGSDA